MDEKTFGELVADAVDSLPEEFLERMENVELFIETWPSHDDLEEAGLTRATSAASWASTTGCRSRSRGAFYSALPDRITIFQRPIERCRRGGRGGDPQSRCGRR